MPSLRLIAMLPVLFALGGCASWSTSSVEPPAGTASPQAAAVKSDPAKIVITETDITDRPYTVLGDISVTVNKTTLFHPDPTKEMVAAKLREEAAGLGADAVVLVRYGTVGVGFMSWGSLDGKGRAVAFAKSN
jgi:hypothetical protein